LRGATNRSLASLLERLSAAGTDGQRADAVSPDENDPEHAARARAGGTAPGHALH
jgi:hypothetical protein